MSTLAGGKFAKDYTFTAVAVAAGSVVQRSAVGGTSERATGPGAVILGVAEEGAAAGARASVVMQGPAKGIAGGAITDGVDLALTSDAAGLLVPAVGGNNIVGWYLGEANAVAGDEIDLFVTLGVS